MKVADLNFSPRYTSQELARGLAWLEENSDRFGDAANFAIVGTGATGDVVLQPYIARVCHRYIKDTQVQERSLVVTECGWKRSSHLTLELVTPYFQWLTEESPYSRFIIWSDVHRGFAVSADVYAPLMQNIMIMTRHFYEMPKFCFERFNRMIGIGVPGNIAYPIAFNSSARHQNENVKFSSYCSHTVSHLFSLEAFKCFVTGELGPDTDVDDSTRHYREYTNYSGGYRLFWPDMDNVPSYLNFTTETGLIPALMEMEGFRNALAELRKSRQIEAYKAPNPFAPKSAAAPTIAPNEVTVFEAVEVVAPFLTQLLYSPRKEP